MKITFLTMTNCFSSGISGLIDTFTIADLWNMDVSGGRSRLFTSEIVSVDGGPVRCNGSMQLMADRAIDDIEEVDYLVLPPLIPVPRFQSPEERKLVQWIIACHDKGIPIAALCTGSFLLAETGLLDGKEATTNWQFARKFIHRYPRVHLRPEKILTEENGLVCTGAATSYFHFGLLVIEKYGSKELATICSKSLLVDSNRTSQAPYFLLPDLKGHTDTDIARAQRFMEKNFARISAIDEIAAHVCLSSRHFKRRFKKATGSSPLAYLQNIRIESAKKLLEYTIDGIDDITYQIGYENPGTFRRLFKERTSLSPREYRDKFARRKE